MNQEPLPGTIAGRADKRRRRAGALDLPLAVGERLDSRSRVLGSARESRMAGRPSEVPSASTLHRYLTFNQLLIYYLSSMDEPLSQPEAKRLIREILARGEVVSSRHATEEMKNDDLTMVDCINVLRGGVVEPAEWENGTWRYRVHTQRIWVVVAFRSETRLVVVTAWRSKR